MDAAEEEAQTKGYNDGKKRRYDPQSERKTKFTGHLKLAYDRGNKFGKIDHERYMQQLRDTD